MGELETLNVEPIVAKGIIGIHKVITRGLIITDEEMQSYLEHYSTDVGFFDGFLDYLRCLTTVLHAHHLVEDEIVFPDFERRSMVAPYALLTKEHVKIEGILDRMNSIIAEPGLNNEDMTSMQDLQFIIESLIDLWEPHIEIEEFRFSENIIGKYLNMEEQRKLSMQIGQHMAKNATPDYLVIPFVYYNLSYEDRAIMKPFLPSNLNFLLESWKDSWISMSPYLLG